MPEELLRKTFEIQGWDFENAGERSAEVTTILKDLDVDPNIILRVGVVAFEAEMNVVMYAGRATLTLVVTDDEIVVEVADEGPGIADIELAMQPGYSTASDEMREMGFGYGLGLPNIKKNSDVFSLQSEVGRGTRLHSIIRLISYG
ncbi:MAG: ATP-binding protein [Terriglobales bacterium]|jgi:anti-sigma regulatory factor (Ser/Thr protein kinase)